MAAHFRWAALVVALMLPGCFLVRSGTAATDDGATGLDGRVADNDAGPPISDGDGDGVPTDRDCDDADPSVGSVAETPCASACGSGIASCVEGTWGRCDAPTVCSCTGTDTRDLDCIRCGTQRQVCESGTWVNDGACSDQGDCAPGALMMGSEPCGVCASGTRTRARMCGSGCDWDAWAAWGACVGESGCMPGTPQMDSRPCGACGSGTQIRTRACDSSCGWPGWSGWGACSGASGCTPGTMQTQTQGCGDCGGTQDRTRTCDSSCAWEAWSGWGSCSASGTVCRWAGTDYCSCDVSGVWTCCSDGDWSSSGCPGCP